MEKALVVYFNNKEVYFIHKGGSQTRKFDDVELMQFTGLLDKNGKEVFEGDIIKLYPNRVRVIEYSEPNGCYMERGTSLNQLHSSSEFEIIGNIYENPKLIKQ